MTLKAETLAPPCGKGLRIYQLWYRGVVWRSRFEEALTATVALNRFAGVPDAPLWGGSA